MVIIEREGIRLELKSMCETCYVLELDSPIVLRNFNILDIAEYELSNNINIEKFEKTVKSTTINIKLRKSLFRHGK